MDYKGMKQKQASQQNNFEIQLWGQGIANLIIIKIHIRKKNKEKIKCSTKHLWNWRAVHNYENKQNTKATTTYKPMGKKIPDIQIKDRSTNYIQMVD
jgi:hypothetical protein